MTSPVTPRAGGAHNSTLFLIQSILFFFKARVLPKGTLQIKHDLICFVAILPQEQEEKDPFDEWRGSGYGLVSHGVRTCLLFYGSVQFTVNTGLKGRNRLILGN